MPQGDSSPFVRTGSAPPSPGRVWHCRRARWGLGQAQAPGLGAGGRGPGNVLLQAPRL